MTEQKIPRRGFYILPNLFTTASLFSAFISILSSIQGDYEAGALFIFLSALLDGLDGKVARLTNTASQFGVEYDSLADVIAFGVAPAVLVWTWQLHDYGRIGCTISFLFIVCAALRLARFNVNINVTSKRFFIGLPSPAAGSILASFVLFSSLLPLSLLQYLPRATLVVCFIVPIFMVSRIRYFSFRECGFIKKHQFRVLVGIILFVLFLLTNPYFWIFVFFGIYLLAGIFYTYMYLPYRNSPILSKINTISKKNKK